MNRLLYKLLFFLLPLLVVICWNNFLVLEYFSQCTFKSAMGSKCKLPVPVYKPDSGYNYYKDLILAWSEVTETPKGSQGIRVALSFNEVDQKLCEKIFTVVKRDVLKKDDGFEKLITFLDKELGKDDLEEIVSIYDDFEDCRKRSGESMNKYISTFDHKSNLLKGKGITLPPEILGFKLLRGAGLTKEERALVLSGIDYEKRESLYEQATKSLKKFKGEGGHSGSSSEFGAGCSSFGGDVTIKTEPAFYTGMRGNFPRTPGAYGQNRPSNRGNYGWRGGRPSVNNPWRGMRHGASGNDSWRGYRGSGMSRGTSYTPSTSWRGSSDNNSGKSWRSGLEGEKQTNAIGMNHQPLQCACCKSIYHFIKDCPDTWESLKKVNLVEEPYNTDEYSANQMYSEEQYDYDQYGNMYSGNVPTHDEYAGQYGNYTGSEGHDHHVVLFTGYNKAEVLQLEVEAHNKAVLDSACSSTVCGKAWLEDFLNSRNPDDKREVERRNSVNLTGLMVAHIDDFLHAGDQSFDEGIVKQLSKRFLAGSNLEGEFKYVGYQISQRAHGIVLDQNAYIDSVDLVKMSAEREMQKSDSLNPTELKQYRSIVGSLNWIVQGSRPDLAFQLVEFSTKFRCGTVDDLIKVRKIMQKARECKSEVCFPDLGSMDDWKIVFYSDASHANLCEGVGSCVGYIIFLVGSNGQCCPLTWKSGKARRVVKSTIAAEAMALLDGIDESLYLKKVILQIMSLNQKDLPVIGIVDHKGLWEAVRSTKLLEDRRLRIEIASVNECLQRGEVMEVRLCSTTEMLADCLTKKGADGRKLLAVLQSGTLEFSL